MQSSRFVYSSTPRTNTHQFSDDGAHWLISSNLSLTRFSADGYIHTYRRGTAATFGMVNLTRVFLLLILILILSKRRLKSRIQKFYDKNKKKKNKENKKEEPFSHVVLLFHVGNTHTHTYHDRSIFYYGMFSPGETSLLFLANIIYTEYGRPWRMVFKKTLDTLFFFIKKKAHNKLSQTCPPPSLQQQKKNSIQIQPRICDDERRPTF